MGAGKSLARPGRKQATATKLGFIQHTPHEAQYTYPVVLTLEATQKKFRSISVQPGLRGSNDLRIGRKMATFQLFFQSRKQMVVRRGQIRRTGWVLKKMEDQVGQFLPGCKCPVSRRIVLQEQDPLGDLTTAYVFPSKCLSIAPAEMCNTSR